MSVMFKKLWLIHNINKFHHIFDDIKPCRAHIRDLNNTDFLLGVQFDIMEALEAYKHGFSEEEYSTYAWLNKIYEQIATLREAPKHNYKPLLKVTAIILVITAALVLGLHMGRSYTIRQAELLETNNDTYYISFGDEVHEYTFEEVR